MVGMSNLGFLPDSSLFSVWDNNSSRDVNRLVLLNIPKQLELKLIDVAKSCNSNFRWCEEYISC